MEHPTLVITGVIFHPSETHLFSAIEKAVSPLKMSLHL